MSPSPDNDKAGGSPPKSEVSGPTVASSVDEPSASTASEAADAHPRQRDALDLFLALFDQLNNVLPALGLLAFGAGVAYLGAICVTTALLRRSAVAQEFFVNVLADMGWSGYAILVMIGAGIALFSIIQLVLWPRGLTWRWLAQRLGRPIAWAASVLWVTTVVVEAVLVGWGFELWTWPRYIEARAALGFTPTPDGLLLISALVAPVIALLPEWCARFGLTLLVCAWRRPAAIEQNKANQQ